MNHPTEKPRDQEADYNDPDIQNAEQNEGDSQAQDVERDAELAPTDRAEDSEHGGRSNPASLIPDDMQDLVDHMNDMARSGRIDMDAFEGEPESMDDEDGSIPE